MQEFVKSHTLTIDIPIAWGDMDAFQHVNNIVYFRYFESVRIAYFEKLDFMTVMQQTGIGPILASTQCKYKIPLTYPDQVTVGAKVDSIEKERFSMQYALFSHAHQKVAATGAGLIVTFDYHNNQKASIPEEVKNRILAFEKKAGNALSA